MRKYFLTVVIAGILALTPTMAIYASETNTDAPIESEETIQEATEGDSEDIDKSVGVIKENFHPSDTERFKKTPDAAAEDESIEQPEPGELWGGYSSYQEYLEANKVTELTPEQAAEGYSINEYGQLEAPNEGDAYSEVIVGGVNPGKNTGYVSVVLDTDADIHEEVYVHFMHMGTFKIYGCYLYEINNYQTQICLPTGSYTVQEAGLTLDTVGRFYSYPRQFVVERASTQILPVSLIDSLEPVDQAGEETSVEEQPTTEITPTVTPEPVTVTDQPTESTDKFHTVEFIITLIILIAMIIGLVVWLKKHSPQGPTRGFDE